MNEVSFKKSGRSEILKIIELLNLHCRKNDRGFAVYDEGYDDEILATMIAPYMTKHHIAPWRIQLFGQFERVSKTVISESAVEARVRKLEEQMAELHTKLAALLA